MNLAEIMENNMFNLLKENSKLNDNEILEVVEKKLLKILNEMNNLDENTRAVQFTVQVNSFPQGEDGNGILLSQMQEGDVEYTFEYLIKT